MQPERYQASVPRLKARKLNLAKMFFNCDLDPAEVVDGTAERKWDELGDAEQRRFLRYAHAAMSGLSVDHSRTLFVDTPVPWEIRARLHADGLRGIAGMDPATEGERMRQWARDSLSGYTLQGWNDYLTAEAQAEAAKTRCDVMARERDEARAEVRRLRDGLLDASRKMDCGVNTSRLIEQILRRDVRCEAAISLTTEG